jgi:hypothetical protein
MCGRGHAGFLHAPQPRRVANSNAVVREKARRLVFGRAADPQSGLRLFTWACGRASYGTCAELRSQPASGDAGWSGRAALAAVGSWSFGFPEGLLIGVDHRASAKTDGAGYYAPSAPKVKKNRSFRTPLADQVSASAAAHPSLRPPFHRPATPARPRRGRVTTPLQRYNFAAVTVSAPVLTQVSAGSAVNRDVFSLRKPHFPANFKRPCAVSLAQTAFFPQPQFRHLTNVRTDTYGN